MRKKPRPPRESLFSRGLVSWSILHGAVAFAAVAAVYLIAGGMGLAEDVARALTFTSLVAVIFSLILVDRSYSSSLVTAIARPNRTLAIVLAVVVTVLSLVLLMPFTRDLFRFGALGFTHIAAAAGTGLGVMLILELLKPLWHLTKGRSF